MGYCNLKRCSKCKQLLGEGNFSKNCRTKDGLNSRCTDCNKAYLKDYYQKPGVKERFKKQQQEYIQRPEIKERRKAYAQQLEVKERSNKYQKKYQQRPEIKKHLEEYRHKYYQRPEVIKKRKEKQNDPVFQKYKKEYMNNYRKTYVVRPELIERRNKRLREHRRQPEVKEKRRREANEYNNKLEVKERREKLRQNPEFRERRKKYHKEYLARPGVTERLIQYRYEYNQKDENKERVKQYRKDNPDKVKTWSRNHFNKRKQLGTTTIMDNPFPEEVEVDFHHFNNMLMIPIPRITHRFGTGHKRYLKKHREHNKEWILKLYRLDVDNLCKEEDFIAS